MGLTSRQSDDLAVLKQNLRESSHPYFEEAQLVRLLELWDWDVNQASFHGLVIKAENDGVTLPSGLALPNNRAYWLSLAKTFRKNGGTAQRRGDEPWR